MNEPDQEIGTVGEDQKTTSPSSANGWNVFIALALCVFAFWNAMSGEFVYDDKYQILQNPLIQSPQLLWTGVTNDVWAFKGDGGGYSSYWRPAFVAWMAVNWQLAGPDPGVWHLFNIALHLLAVWLAYKTLIRLKIGAAIAAFATWLFAIHPTKSESVAWIAGSPDILMAIFFFLSVGVFADYLENKKTAKLLWTGFWFLMALFSKEAALPLVLFYPILAASWTNDGAGKSHWKAAIPILVALIPVVIIWMGMRQIVLGSFSLGYPNSPTLVQTLISLPLVFCFYLYHAFVPTDLAVLYDVKPLGASEVGAPLFILSALCTLIFLGFALMMSRRGNVFRYGIALFVLPLIPAMVIKVFKPDDIVHDRYLYLPTLGLALVVGGVIWGMGAAMGRSSKAANRLTYGAGAAVTLLFAFLTIRNNVNWHDEVSMWSQAAKVSPNSSVAHLELAEAQRLDKDLEVAEASISRAIALNATRPNTMVIAGLIARDRGDNALAEQRLLQATKDFRETPLAWEQLLAFYDRTNHPEEMIAASREAERAIPPLKSRYQVSLAIGEYKLGRREEALRILESTAPEATRSRDPRLLQGLFLLGALHRELGNTSKSEQYFRVFLARTAGIGDEKIAVMRRNAEMALGSTSR